MFQHFWPLLAVSHHPFHLPSSFSNFHDFSSFSSVFTSCHCHYIITLYNFRIFNHILSCLIIFCKSHLLHHNFPSFPCVLMIFTSVANFHHFRSHHFPLFSECLVLFIVITSHNHSSQFLLQNHALVRGVLRFRALNPTKRHSQKKSKKQINAFEPSDDH